MVIACDCYVQSKLLCGLPIALDLPDCWLLLETDSYHSHSPKYMGMKPRSIMGDRPGPTDNWRSQMKGLQIWISPERANHKPTYRGLFVGSRFLGHRNSQLSAGAEVECHKMMCRNCDTKFCFKCSSVAWPTFGAAGATLGVAGAS